MSTQCFEILILDFLFVQRNPSLHTPFFHPDGPAMNTISPTSSATSSSSAPFALSSILSIRRISPLPSPQKISVNSITTTPNPTSSRPFSSISAQPTTNAPVGNGTPPATTSLSASSYSSYPEDQPLLALLRQRKTEEAWNLYSQSSTLPSPTCLSRLVAQLSYKNDPESISRAQSIINRLRHDQQLHRLDANSLGLLASSSAKSGHTLYANSIIKSMLRSNYLPHVKAWSAVVSRLAASGDDGPLEALRLYNSVMKRLRQFSDLTVAADSRPDTAAFNAALNACANIGDVKKFCQVFDEMSEFSAVPDVLTYNVMIKLFARINRKDLLVYVLELILNRGVEFCVTTLHSLVAAYVGFGDLDTAEQLVQGMREGRRDICKILRDANSVDPDEEEEEEELIRSENGLLEMLLPNLNEQRRKSDPSLMLPKAYATNSRLYTTLMKGYMKAGRVADTVRMLEAMRRQEDKASHPDHVSYTTVISAFVKAGSMDKARQVLAEMTRIGVPANRITYNILLKGYCQQLQIEEAKGLIHEMANDAGISPDVVSYNTLIDGCILVDDSSGALSYFNEMRAKGIAPTKISYTTLMKAFALSGQPKLANKVFDEMLKDPRVKIDRPAWNMLVEAYCKLGLAEEAKKVVQKMKEYGFYPDVATYGSLANGIALARKPGEALLLWNEIKERCRTKENDNKANDSSSLPPPIRPDAGLLHTLADVCVRAAFFKKALEIVACMEEYEIPPNKTKFTRIYVEMHSRMFTSKHASRARQDRRKDRKRAAEAFKFWLGLPNSYYGSEWRLDSTAEDE